MSQAYRIAFILLLSVITQQLSAQNSIKGKIFDAASKEPVQGATVNCVHDGCNSLAITDSYGGFSMRCNHCESVSITSIGYAAQEVKLYTDNNIISLSPSQSLLQQVIVSANRGEGVKRSMAPVAVSTLSNKTIQDTKPTTIDQVLNKVSGVNMVSLGNEQHQMSIRQPMTTKSLFLYLEDGIPVRTTGLYNHNALLEMNMASVKSIEVIKGPSSSLYGSEAIGGVVNMITAAPTAVPVLKLSAQGNDIGYKRGDLLAASAKENGDLFLAATMLIKEMDTLEYSDFQKSTITARIDYRFSEKTTLSNSVTWLKYYSDMSGGIDSTMFATAVSKIFKHLLTEK